MEIYALMWMIFEDGPPSIDWPGLWKWLFHTSLNPLDGILIVIATSLISMWIKTRLEESIKRIYAEKLEDYKRELSVRDQAARVAELLALVRSATSADIAKANQLAWELSLWLPAETVRRLAEHLTKAPNQSDHRPTLIEARRILLNLEKPDLTEKEIVTFSETLQR
jgi:hypothetical protein